MSRGKLNNFLFSGVVEDPRDSYPQVTSVLRRQVLGGYLQMIYRGNYVGALNIIKRQLCWLSEY